MDYYSKFHVTQLEKWDCGIACFEMAMKYIHIDSKLSVDVSSLRDLGRPLWTIDIMESLVNHNIDCVMYTVLVGINPGFMGMTWYRGDMKSDESRVLEKFEVARRKGWRVEERSLSIDDIICGLAHGSIAIVLINVNILKNTDCESIEFKGHYILVVKFEESSQSILYLDPANNQGNTLQMSVDKFEASRRCFGTDEDIIICSRPR